MLVFLNASKVIFWRDLIMHLHAMMFQRAKPKYTSCHLSLFNVNNRNKVGGLWIVKSCFLGNKKNISKCLLMFLPRVQSVIFYLRKGCF